MRTKLSFAFLFLILGVLLIAPPAEAGPAVYWHWMTLKLSDSSCGQRAVRALAAEKIGKLDRRGSDTVWASNSRVTTTIQCIRLEKKKSLAVIIVSSNSRSEAKSLRDILKLNMRGDLVD